jgi:hypothetical protein
MRKTTRTVEKHEEEKHGDHGTVERAINNNERPEK